MAKKSITRKVFVNKRTKQLSFSLSKKQLKRMKPSLRFGEDLFVEIQLDSIKNLKKRE